MGVAQVVQLEELLGVRHSVFVVGAAGTGKSQVLRALHRTYQRMKLRPVWTDLNPKAVTNDELFGIINPATREWRDGKCLFMPEFGEEIVVFNEVPEWQQDGGSLWAGLPAVGGFAVGRALRVAQLFGNLSFCHKDNYHVH